MVHGEVLDDPAGGGHPRESGLNSEDKLLHGWLNCCVVIATIIRKNNVMLLLNKRGC